MFGLSYAEMQQVVREARLDGLNTLDVVVLRNVTVEPIEPYLKYLAYRLGFNARITFGAYDNILQDASTGPAGMIGSETDFIIVFLQLATISPDLVLNFARLGPEAIQSEVVRVQEYVVTVLAELRRHSRASILWHGFESLCDPVLGILDNQGSFGQASVIETLNASLKSHLQAIGNAFYVDINLCLMRIGARHFYDARYWHIARAPYSRAALEEIALEDGKFIRALQGKAKKCLVLDCDNVLWGGIIGEDGLEGIHLGASHPGSAYQAFQTKLLSLFQRGVILALCSKNNEADVWEVFRSHPEMVLKEEHISAAQINWHDKASNLRRIAEDLNIGLDSIVFADDSEFEIELVRSALPQVEVIHLPEKRAVDFLDLMASCGWFDTLALSDEDRARGRMYRAELERKRAKETVKDLPSYLSSLKMEVEISRADVLNIPRIAQLTQRTNQFNLTNRRYSDADIRALAESPGSTVLTLKVNDRFGDSGLVGAAVLRYAENSAEIDAFLISCRVIGRGVEDVFLEECLELLQKQSVCHLIGRYVRTKKNVLVAEFYPRHGFTCQSENADESVFHLSLPRPRPQLPDYFHSIRVRT
jgi:FkbH-like protein